ncbi:uncharacterized protein TRUGW13939_01081 [Talaromyces rugulosus]|uniref:Uncharacterized protein n=1 Tax=Talaromyces rugulosus TaxID=121627 RepID=A0A7H8QJ69_TALRU|nr:uncharacterized protein TRUGW13939_01081 [Talaromyces rugulosus]QKX53999.1 hypothetical protein TRUGW13939_01081 [Talaromyces rugulosus]
MAPTGHLLPLRTARPQTCMKAFNASAPLRRSFATGPSDGQPPQRPSSTTPNRPQREQQQQQFRPRPVDARSLAAPRSGDGQVKILRTPNLRLRGAQFGKNGRPPGGPPGAGGFRRSGYNNNNNFNNNNNKGGNKGRGGKKPRDKNARKRQQGEEAGEDVRAAEIEEIFNEQKAKELQVATRYTPVQYDVSKLQETWPSLPIGTTAQAGSVLEKLNFLSRRFPNGYEPPHELAKRLFDGERVIFRSDEEKKAAIEEFNKLAHKRADRLTQRKGEVVEPEAAGFTSTSKEDQSAFVGQLVQGKYATQQNQSNPVLGEIERQLFNNETYRTAGKQSGFMAKMESLIASAQPAKRIAK